MPGAVTTAVRTAVVALGGVLTLLGFAVLLTTVYLADPPRPRYVRQ